jgi:alpha-tubulin suppressor-like RCC1 family protein
VKIRVDIARVAVGFVITAGAIGIVAGGPAAGAAPRIAPAAVVGSPSSGPFTSVPAARLLDTRTGFGVRAGAVGAGKTVAVTVAGRGRVPVSGVSAVALTVTVSAPKKGGGVTVYPDGSARPGYSDLAFGAGQTVSGLVVARLGTDGKVDLHNGSAGTVQLTGYVSGYFTGGGSRSNGAFTSLTSARLLDTRSGVGVRAGAVGARKTVRLTVDGRGGVPAARVAAVTLTVTVSGPGRAGSITVFRDGSSRPASANLNFAAGRAVSGVVVVRVGGDGRVDLYNGSAGTVQLTAYVSGYFTGSGSKSNGAFTSAGPNRLLDTRAGFGVRAGPVGSRKIVTLTVAGRGGVPASGVAAVALTVTVAAPKKGGAITVYADGSARPASSDLAFLAGQTVSDLVIAPVGTDGKVDLYNGSAGTVQLTGYVSGYFNTILSGVVRLVTNSNSSCALLASGGVECWGDNAEDALGSGAGPEFSYLPLVVKGVGGRGTLGGVASIATDGGGFCGVLKSGGVDCWGANGDGDLGDGGVADSPVPVPVKGVGGVGKLSGAASIAGGFFSYCALLKAGEVDCWGNNALYGGLGTGSTGSFSAVAEPVKGVGGTGKLSGVASVVSDGTTMCAILTSRTVDCWGGQPIPVLGNGTDSSSNVPVVVEGAGGIGKLGGVVRLSAQGETICALLTSRQVDCWGLGSDGVLGAGEAVPSSEVPVPVLGLGGTGTLTGVAALSGDGRTACALLSSGKVDCWGEDNEGQLGTGTIPPTGNSFVPVAVVGVHGTGTLSGVAQVITDFSSFCAVLGSGGLDCWGGNTGGQLGDGNISGPQICGGDACSMTPAPVLSTRGQGALTGLASVVSNSLDEVGGFGYYAILRSGAVDCWGAGTDAQGVLGNDPFMDSGAYSVPAPV